MTSDHHMSNKVFEIFQDPEMILKRLTFQALFFCTCRRRRCPKEDLLTKLTRNMGITDSAENASTPSCRLRLLLCCWSHHILFQFFFSTTSSLSSTPCRHRSHCRSCSSGGRSYYCTKYNSTYLVKDPINVKLCTTYGTMYIYLWL